MYIHGNKVSIEVHNSNIKVVNHLDLRTVTGTGHLKSVIHTEMPLHSFCFLSNDLKLHPVWL